MLLVTCLSLYNLKRLRLSDSFVVDRLSNCSLWSSTSTWYCSYGRPSEIVPVWFWMATESPMPIKGSSNPWRDLPSVIKLFCDLRVSPYGSVSKLIMLILIWTLIFGGGSEGSTFRCTFVIEQYSHIGVASNVDTYEAACSWSPSFIIAVTMNYDRR